MAKDINKLKIGELYMLKSMILDLLEKYTNEVSYLLKKKDDEMTQEELNHKAILGAKHQKGAKVLQKINNAVESIINEYME